MIRKIAVNLCRAVLGATLVFSGLVKAVDPLGTQYKIRDYLTAIGLPKTGDWLTLGASVGLSALEFCLGVFLLLAIRRRQASRAALGLMLVMTVISVWLVIANPVQDCGCFGDAVRLTNGQTLGKNIVLTVCAAVLARWPLLMTRFIGPKWQWIVTHAALIGIIGFSLWCLYDLPVADFRPYSKGTDLRKALRDDAEIEKYLDFSIEDMRSGRDLTDSILAVRGAVLLLVAPQLERASDENFGEIDRLHEWASDEDVPMYCLTASGDKAIRRWIDLTGAEYPFCRTDETTLRTVIRSNPGLLLLQDGVITGKWSHHRLPAPETLENQIKQHNKT